jgi:ribosomal protein L11 methyltransferase
MSPRVVARVEEIAVVGNIRRYRDTRSLTMPAFPKKTVFFNGKVNTDMGYYEFTVRAPEESKDALSAKMAEMGCLGSYEKAGKLIAYFPDRLDIMKLRDELNAFRAVLKDSGLPHEISFDYLFISERDWNESWKKRFLPIEVGENLLIVPPWDERVTTRTKLVIDPGMAFGTGHHETTMRCLAIIEKYAKDSGAATAAVSSKGRFLDVGTGTGILAIAAAKLGFREVVGVDTDPLAVDAATRNAVLNDLTNVTVREGEITAIEDAADMIAANLMSEILIRIAPEIARRLNPSGVAILSGMLTGQEDDVIIAMEKEGLTVIERYRDDRWVSLVFSQ